MSQDIHTPRVIASPFLSKKRLRAILKPSARRWPETLPTMDEVDGRPGPVALQFGHLDALKRVPTASLSLPLKFTVILPQPGVNPKTETVPSATLCRERSMEWRTTVCDIVRHFGWRRSSG